jgi:hypothetical protein
MAITSAEVKKLWGLAAGRCSAPGCNVECVTLLTSDPTVIGEMAHVSRAARAALVADAARGAINMTTWFCCARRITEPSTRLPPKATRQIC